MDNISIRFAKKDDEKEVISWLSDPVILRWFPMWNHNEIVDSTRIWFSYIPLKAVLTSLWNGKVCGSAILYISGFKKMAHQCLFAIIVEKEYRGKGVGTRLLEELMHLAKERFSIELLHLEVYQGNPAYNLYKRMGFEEYGIHKKFLKEEDGTYLDKILMQKRL